MKEIFDYIGSNPFLTTIIGAFVGGFFSTFNAIYISNKERKERKLDELAREQREQFNKKAELRIVNNKKSSKRKPDIEVFISPYITEFKEKTEDYDAIFPKDILDKSKHKYEDFTLKNIGKSDINYLYVCAANQVNTMLVEYSSLNSWVKDKFAFYSALCQKKILVDEDVVIRIYYLEDYKVSFAFSTAISLLFEDEYKHLWAQSFFYESQILEVPSKIDYKHLREHITADEITGYFQSQWHLWNDRRKKK